MLKFFNKVNCEKAVQIYRILFEQRNQLKMRQKRGNKRSTFPSSDEESIESQSQVFHQTHRLPQRSQNERRPRTVSNYTQISKGYMSQEEQDQKQFIYDDDESDSQDITYYYGGKIKRIYATRTRQGTNEIEKLCKIDSVSYLHIEWLTEKQIIQRKIQPTKFNQGQQIRHVHQLQLIQDKYGPEHYCNPAYRKVDRILTTSVLFPVMHHKKASEMNGKWCESLTMVCSKLLNFEKYHIAYGIVQKDDYEASQIQEFQLKSTIKFQHVINRLYLDRYRNSEQFWNDMGKCLQTMYIVYKNTSYEYYWQVLKQCTIFLYWQWFVFSRQRYCQIAKQLNFQFIPDKIEKEKVNFSIEDEPLTDWNKFVAKNILLTETKVQTPTSERQLKRLSPKQFTYKWLSQEEDHKTYVFKHLNSEDFEKLSLNQSINTLYLIKWSELDYDSTTWEKQSDLEEFKQKIKNFKLYCKVPPKKIRDRIQEHKKYHKAILAQQNEQANEAVQTIDKYRRRLYSLGKGKQGPKQYGEQDKPIYKDYKVLKQFQLQGLNWLIKSWHQRKNCILADQMGLGKTVQTIAFLNHLTIYEDVLGPFLVVAPVSTLKQWRFEIEQWSDLNCVLYKGKSTCRKDIEQYEFYHKFVTNQGFFVKFQKLIRFQVFLTNYQLLLNEFEMIQKFPFQYIILDEAQKVKNQNTRISKAIRQLPCPRILLLTGTPIQNKTSQLWGLLNIVEPKRFHSYSDFTNKYGQIKNSSQLDSLRNLLKPYLLRRVKSDVEKSIPKLTETLVTLDLTTIQKSYYRSIIENKKNQLISPLTSVSLNNLALCLRQCCNHPYMLSQNVQADITKQCEDPQEKANLFIKCSSKLIFVHKFLTKAIKNKEKTLIFTQFRYMVQLLGQYCKCHKIGYEWLDGNVGYEQRHTRIDRFNKIPEVSVFIISTKAGGIGVNLTSATNIIIYDSDWNPQNDIQAIARAHRIGQKNKVSVYRLITNKTYEDNIYKTAVKKLGIGLAILDDEFFATTTMQQSSTSNKKNRSKEQIEKLLKEGVVSFLKSQDEEKEGVNFQNISIQQIIEKSGKAVDYQTKQCQYKSAKFQVEGQKQLDINDPNFWEVALKDVESPLQKLVKQLKMNSPTRGDILNSISLQTDLIIESNNIVHQLIKSKIQMKNYNAQDQRELKNFLEEITDSRQFHRGFKKIANDWLEEIEKPSRRYDKIKVETIRAIAGDTRQNKQQMQSSKKNTRNSTKRQNKLKISSSGSQSSNQDESNENQSPEKKIKGDKKDIQEQEIPKIVKRRNGKVVKQKKQKGSNSQQDSNQLLQGICAFCDQKKCSKICDGMCNRMFHSLCYEKYVKGEKYTGDQYIKQNSFSQQEFKEALSQQFYCQECNKGYGICCLCQTSSPAKTMNPKGKYRRPKISQENKREDNNYIDEVVKKMTKKEQQTVYQCRLTSCSKFFHLQCLQKMKNHMVFQIDLANQSEYYALKCPKHFCMVCRAQSSSIGLSCLKCPVACHTKCKSQKQKDFDPIYDYLFICKSHKSKQSKGYQPVVKRNQNQKNKEVSSFKQDQEIKQMMQQQQPVIKPIAENQAVAEHKQEKQDIKDQANEIDMEAEMLEKKGKKERIKQKILKKMNNQQLAQRQQKKGEEEKGEERIRIE